MGRFGGTRVKALLAGLVLTLFTLVGTTVWGLLRTLAALLDPGAQPLLAALVTAAAPWVVASVLLTLLAGTLLLWLSIVLASRVTLPSLESERLSGLAALVEYYVPAARSAGLSEWLAPREPTADEKLEAVKEAYVDGDLSRHEFERKVEQLYETEEELDRDTLPSRLDRLLAEPDRTREFPQHTGEDRDQATEQESL